jgi:Subtilase family
MFRILFFTKEGLLCLARHVKFLSAFIYLLAATHFSFSQNKNQYTPDSAFNKYTSGHISSFPVFYVVKIKNTATTLAPGLKIIRAISPLVFIVSIADSGWLNSKKEYVEKIAPAGDSWKLSPSLEKETGLHQDKNNRHSYIIVADDIENLTRTWGRRKPAIEVANIYKKQNSAIINCTPDYFFSQVLSDNAVLFADIYLQASPEIQLIGYNRGINGINLAQYTIPGATGEGISIGIKEKKMDAGDIDLQRRVLPSSIAAAESDNHATVISSLAGGAGNSYYSGKGLAWKCKFFPSSYDALFPDDGSLLAQNGVTVQNHSYGTIIQNFYGAEAAGYDAQAAQHTNILHIFSSGNKGQETSAQGPYANIAGYANLTGNFKMAKNIITVAAIDTDYIIAPFSSAGPLFDGRMAPQVAALGPNGTSDAAALVSGTAALLQQVYKDSNNGVLPAASLIKAVLYNTADDVGNKGIDYRSGFGAINVYSAIKTIQQRKFAGGSLLQNETWTKSITIPPQAANLKITLSWTDTSSGINNFKALVNDLDLELIETSTGRIFRPWCLSTVAAIDSLQAIPVRKRDSLNTAEQVSIERPDAGQYQLKISARQVQTINKQDFNIAYNWDTIGTFYFTNPVNSDDIDRNENNILSIRWKTTVADATNTGSLYISYNGGTSWKLLATSLQLSLQKFNWPIPDTATASLLRMDTPSGTFYSVPFIISPVTKMNVEFVCTDSMQLSWNKHVYASSYQLYTRTDSAYLKPLLLTADTAITLQRTATTGTVYAVQPILNNNLSATRSAAIDVRDLGVGCFYKTLLAENRGNNVQLVLQLSTTSSTDSIFFEKVNSNGSNATTLSKQKTISGQFSYSATDAAPFAGRNFYRALIKLKGGGIIYSEIVSIISNGDQFIFLYPNPLARNQPLHYQLLTAADGTRFQLLDINGRLVNTQLIGFSGNLATNGLPQGIYFVRLVKTDGAIIPAGKLIITN